MKTYTAIYQIGNESHSKEITARSFPTAKKEAAKYQQENGRLIMVMLRTH